MKQLTLTGWQNPWQTVSALWQRDDNAAYDQLFLTLLMLILAIGVVMVTSASMPVAERLFNNPLHFTIRHLVYLGIGLTMAVLVLRVPVSWWHRGNMWLLLLGILLLVAVLLFGRNVNGSSRWL